MIICDLNLLELTFDSNNLLGARKSGTDVPRQSFADAQAFSFVDDTTGADYDVVEIGVSASTFALVELGRSSAASNSFAFFKGS